MNYKKMVVYFFLTVGFISIITADEMKVTEHRGAYFGQKLPYANAEPFASGVISADGFLKHGPIVIANEGNEIYWAVARPRTIYWTHIVNGVWTKPEPAPFAQGLEAFNPAISPDGKRLFFTTQEILNRDDPKKMQFMIWLWYVDREKNGWSKPIAVDKIINAGDINYQVSVAANGTLYFAAERVGGKGGDDIYYSQLKNGNYTTPVRLDETVNTALGESSVYIAPDESYLLFRRIKRVERKMEITFFVSFHTKDGSWTKAADIGEKLGVVGNGFWIGGTPDGKFISFVMADMTKAQNIYWIDASFIKKIQKEELS